MLLAALMALSGPASINAQEEENSTITSFDAFLVPVTNKHELTRLLPGESITIEWENPQFEGIEIPYSRVSFYVTDLAVFDYQRHEQIEVLHQEKDDVFTAVMPGEATLGSFVEYEQKDFEEILKAHPDLDGKILEEGETLTAQVGYYVYRLYNPNTGEHLYTTGEYEASYLEYRGWKREGIAWAAPYKSNTPVYRLYNANASDHHYTSDKHEVSVLEKAGWKNEGVFWYADDENEMELYRFYNPNAVSGSHHFTSDPVEAAALVKAGWKQETMTWSAMNPD